MTAIPPRIDVRCDRADVPQDASNLAARAAAALLVEAGLGGRIGLEIRKMISPGSGLGGGSGNAATVLRAERAASPRRHGGAPAAAGGRARRRRAVISRRGTGAGTRHRRGRAAGG